MTTTTTTTRRTTASSRRCDYSKSAERATIMDRIMWEFIETQNSCLSGQRPRLIYHSLGSLLRSPVRGRNSWQWGRVLRRSKPGPARSSKDSASLCPLETSKLVVPTMLLLLLVPLSAPCTAHTCSGSRPTLDRALLHVKMHPFGSFLKPPSRCATDSHTFSYSEK